MESAVFIEENRGGNLGFRNVLGNEPVKAYLKKALLELLKGLFLAADISVPYSDKMFTMVGLK